MISIPSRLLFFVQIRTELVSNNTMALVSLPAFFVFVVAFSTESFAAYSISCELDVHENCDKEYGRIISHSNGIHTWTEEDLSVYCSGIVEDIDCKQAYLEKCGNETDSMVYKSLTGRLRDMAKDICNETSDLRADFRLHNACIRNVSTKFDLCMQLSVFRTQDDMDGKRDNMTKTEFVLRTLCRFQDFFAECFSAEVGIACGQDASNFVKTIMSRSKVFQNICAQDDLSPLVQTLENKALERGEGS